MLVQCQKEFGDRWFFPLVDAGHPSKLSWPADKISCNGRFYFVPAPAAQVGDCPFLHVVDLKEWLAMEYTWEAPISRTCRHGLANSPRIKGAVAFQITKPEGLLPYAARRAFFNLSNTALLQLGKDLRADMSVGDTLVERIVQLVKHILGLRFESKWPFNWWQNGLPNLICMFTVLPSPPICLRLFTFSCLFTQTLPHLCWSQVGCPARFCTYLDMPVHTIAPCCLFAYRPIPRPGRGRHVCHYLE